LQGESPGRRDDLESLGYTIMTLINEGFVPWRNLSKKEDISNKKYYFLHCDASEIPKVFVKISKYIKHCYHTDYEAEPNYS
jgi:hypothetical protein